jgi:hypothetical protein
MRPPACVSCKWGSGTTCEKPTIGTKELSDKLAAIQAEREKQDNTFWTPHSINIKNGSKQKITK